MSRDDTLAMRCMFFCCCVKYISHLSVYIAAPFFGSTYMTSELSDFFPFENFPNCIEESKVCRREGGGG